jgi:hypothetical protein
MALELDAVRASSTDDCRSAPAVSTDRYLLRNRPERRDTNDSLQPTSRW